MLILILILNYTRKRGKHRASILGLGMLGAFHLIPRGGGGVRVLILEFFVFSSVGVEYFFMLRVEYFFFEVNYMYILQDAIYYY